MTPKELIQYLEYTNDNLELTILPTSEYDRLRKVERMAKAMFEDKRAKILQKTLDSAPRV